MNSYRLIFVLVLLVSGFSASRSANAASPEPQGTLAASTGNVSAATRVQVQMTDTMPELTAQQRAWLAARGDRGPLPAASLLRAGSTAVARPDSLPDPGLAIDAPTSSATSSPSVVSVPAAFTMFRNTTLGAVIKSHTSGATGEPTIANSGPVSFATGNWWAAVSQDGGQTFKYISPYAQFTASFGGFCCDQWVVYDSSRDVFIWYLQYIASGATGPGKNLFRIAVGRPSDVIKGTWWTYDFTSADNTEWDYPDLWLGNDYLYITTNRGTYNAGSVNTSFVFRMPLDALSTGAGFGYGFVDLGASGIAANLSWKGARGNRDTMYMAAHVTTSQIRIMRWPENSGSLSWNDVNLSAAWPNAARVCPVPTGGNWCGFDDGRIKAGWMGRGLIGFMWNASAGGAFTYPYLEAVQVQESDRTYVDRPYSFGILGAHQYAAAAPNMRGDVGMVGHYSSASYYPYLYVAINDDFTRDAGQRWEYYWVRTSTQGPTANRWGDYFSVTAHQPTGLAWLASGNTMQGCSGVGCKETQYMVFGRERDSRGVNNYMDVPPAPPTPPAKVVVIPMF